MDFYKKMNFGTMSCFPTRRRSNLPKMEDYVFIDPGIQDLKRITPCVLPIVAAFRPANGDQLWESIENAWEELVDSYDMRTLIASMPRRLENIVVSNGCAIKY
ncbi:hypothetical protein NQ318_020749 [Aromia moschata]|uniref:Uncharacterized protein n=1 Tax=Aromia moschata TaxID=1265417 RepID=A0AAV8YZH0_9CUCU|nr:hypothetical protein NQ318_020749 [Aromia moschata]